VHKTSSQLSHLTRQKLPIFNKILAFFLFSLLNLTLLNKAIALPFSEQPIKLPSTIQFNSVLQAELINMQQAIGNLHQQKFSYPNGRLPKELTEKIAKVSYNNSLRLSAMIKDHGWPNINLVGIKGRDAAIVIVQQAKVSMQQSLLPILEAEFKQGQLSGQKLASIIDIMLIKSGKKQRFGTQLAIVNGQIVFNDIADKTNLEQRRLAMNMLPMAQYKVLLKKMYQLD